MTRPKSGGMGLLIINADDWGRDCETTDRTLECILQGAVSSVSAMVFMQDSARAADIALERGIDAGLHLNLTEPFSAPGLRPGLMDNLERVARYLLSHRFAPAVFHPGLMRSFEFLVAAQCEEYHRLFGAEPTRFDGHHHMHLCSNVVLGRLLPAGTQIRRSFSFQRVEKSFANRLYRRVLDDFMKRHHQMVDFLFSLPPLEPPSRLQRIFSLAREFVVEVETHPVNPVEFRFLSGGEIFRATLGVQLASRYITAAGISTQ